MSKIELKARKKTENKLRWDKYLEEDDIVFELYIPKWRVPKSWPGRILVSIHNFEGDLSESSDMKEPSYLEEPINVVIKLFEEHTERIEYWPIGKNKKDWPTGRVYIPKHLIPKKPDLFLLRVEWNVNSMGEFSKELDKLRK